VNGSAKTASCDPPLPLHVSARRGPSLGLVTNLRLVWWSSTGETWRASTGQTKRYRPRDGLEVVTIVEGVS